MVIKEVNLMDSVKILQIKYNNLPFYQSGSFTYNLLATDRVASKSSVFPIQGSIYTQNLSAIVGINASGKTMALKLIHLAMSIVLNNASLNSENLPGRQLIHDGTELTITFIYKAKCHQLHATFGKTFHEKLKKEYLYYKEERLAAKPLNSIKTKKDAFDFSKVSDKSIVIRSQLPDTMRSILQDDDSIVITVTKNNTTVCENLLALNDNNILITSGKMTGDSLHVFDPNLDEIVANKKTASDTTYKITFKNQEAITLTSLQQLNNFISSGTIKGQNMIFLIRNALVSGGYVIVDELENHMNKEILHVLTNIFKDNRLNPLGACLIFSTHYTEILDFIDRKDSVYIARKSLETPTKLDFFNYSHSNDSLMRKIRNDIKKSDVFLSNYLGGTAPMYEDIKALEAYLCHKE